MKAPKINHPDESKKPRKKVVVYARVSTEEQTKALYGSCDSQLDEGEAEALKKGWEVVERIKDEGYPATSLKRPGMARLRHLVTTRQIQAVIITWINRLAGGRVFYIFDNDLIENNVDLVTIHDKYDRRTSTGRLVQNTLVSIKAFENEQIGEKVSTKMRMMKEKGMWNGHLIPFGFLCNPKTNILYPDPEKTALVRQLFEVYVDSQSDCVVRDWLKAHGVPSPSGKPDWTKSTLRDLLMNRRYIAEIEINPNNKDADEQDVPEFAQYRIVPAPHEPMVPRELWEQAQTVRRDKAKKSPNRRGKARNYSQNQCQRVYVLQGHLTCGICGASMTPTYSYKKPGRGRSNGSYFFYYVCAKQQMSTRALTGHTNRVRAEECESWIVDMIEGLAGNREVVEQVFAAAKRKCESAASPEREALAEVRRALAENQAQTDQIIQTISSGQALGALMGILNQKAEQLSVEKERLRMEQRRLSNLLAVTDHSFDAEAFRRVLQDFSALAQEATSEELQKMLRLLVKKITWAPKPDSEPEELELHHVEFFLPASTPAAKAEVENWFESKGWIGCPLHRSLKPLAIELAHDTSGTPELDTAIVASI